MFLLFFCSDVGRRHCVLPRGMPKRKGKDVLDMTKQCMLSFGRAELAAEPEDEDDEDDGGESEGEDEDE